MRLLDYPKRRQFTAEERRYFRGGLCIAPADDGLCGIKTVEPGLVADPDTLSAAVLFCPSHLSECYREAKTGAES